MKIIHFGRLPVARHMGLLLLGAVSGSIVAAGAQEPSAGSDKGREQATPPSRELQMTEARDRASIRGRIEGFRHFRPRGGEEQERGNEETLIQLRLQDGRTVTVALGARADLDELDLQRNDFIAAEGRAGMVEGVPALIAERLDVNGRRIQIGQGGAARQADGRPARDRGEKRRRDPVIEADARALLEKMRNAYREISALQLAGTVSTHIEAGDSVLKTSLGFTSAYQSPDRFRHDTTDLLIGSTGVQAFAFNKKTKNYVQQALAKDRSFAESIPALARAALHLQNPSLLAAVLRQPFESLLQSVERVEKLDDGVIDGERFPQLVFRGLGHHGPISVLVDPKTHLVRRVTVDQRPALEKKSDGARVREAVTTIDYTMIDTQPKLAEDRFAWQPPADASDAAQQSTSEQKSASRLVGKEAPDFQLTALDGRQVSLADLRGKVVVLDFWASWCPPCQEALPHFGRIYRQKMKEGVEILAINVGEERDRVSTFVQMENLTLPVLLDPEGKVAQQYQVRGIPKTVVIGKDGKVTDVFTGLGADSYEQINAAIAKASGAATSAVAPSAGTR